MAMDVEKWSGIHIRDRMTTKSQSVLPIGRLNHNNGPVWLNQLFFLIIFLQ